MRLFWAVTLSTLSGFVALSYEILWVRAYGFATQGEPEAFALLLCAYLAGLAAGSLFARRYCERVTAGRPARHLYLVGVFLLCANVAAFPLIPAIAELIGVYQVAPRHVLPSFGIVAALLGTGFPLLAHFAVAPYAKIARPSRVLIDKVDGILDEIDCYLKAPECWCLVVVLHAIYLVHTAQ